MAIAVMSRVFAMSAASISSTERLVLLALANHADATGNRVFPSVATIVDETSLARRTIQLALRALAGRGFIVAVGRRSRGTVVYRINLARLVERERAAHLRPEHGAADSQQPACGASATRDICTNAVQPVHLSGAPNAPDPSSDPSRKPSSKSTAPNGAGFADRSDPQANDRALLALAHHAADALGQSAPISELSEWVKAQAARANIIYDAGRVALAVTVMCCQRDRVGRRGGPPQGSREFVEARSKWATPA
jgi:DNA-binding transcriptional MocR family regulator